MSFLGVADFRRLVLGSYGRSGRPLPWRGTRNPYAVLVSELMLQQTQVARVEPAWLAFMERFPNVGALAAAPLAEVVTAWRGLGYNRRAVNFHRAARVILERHGGEVPCDLDALRALPGVGEYTARAVLAFAFEADVAPVDTNVARVLSRAVACEGLTRRQTQDLADELVPPERAHDWSQALMDLGAGWCTARAPRCVDCPVATACSWRGRGGPDPAVTTAVRGRKQPAFMGSNRFHRGRLVDALRRGPVRAGGLGAAAGLDDDSRLERVARGLIDDGLAEWRGDVLCLPGSPAGEGRG